MAVLRIAVDDIELGTPISAGPMVTILKESELVKIASLLGKPIIVRRETGTQYVFDGKAVYMHRKAAPAKGK